MPDQYEETRARMKDYGPPIVGAIVVLLLIFGAWFLLRGGVGQPAEEQLPGEQIEQALTSPSPSPTPPVQQIGDADELPQAGFPLGATAVAFLLSIAAGWKLRKLSR